MTASSTSQPITRLPEALGPLLAAADVLVVLENAADAEAPLQLIGEIIDERPDCRPCDS